MAINPHSRNITEDKEQFLWGAENQEEEDFHREYTQGGVYPIQGYDNEGNKVPISAYDRNQTARYWRQGGAGSREFRRMVEEWEAQDKANARNVEMNQNDNIENGIGIENPLEIAAANEFGQGQGGDEGIDWLNMGRWGESLGQSVQDFPGNIKGMLGRLWNSGGGGGSNQEPSYPQTPNWPITIPKEDEGRY